MEWSYHHTLSLSLSPSPSHTHKTHINMHTHKHTHTHTHTHTYIHTHIRTHHTHYLQNFFFIIRYIFVFFLPFCLNPPLTSLTAIKEVNVAYPKTGCSLVPVHWPLGDQQSLESAVQHQLHLSLCCLLGWNIKFKIWVKKVFIVVWSM